MPPVKQSLSFPLFSRLAVVFLVLVVVVVFLVIAGTGGEVEIQLKPTVTNRTIETFISVSATSTEGTLLAVFEDKTFEKNVAVESTEGKVVEQKARYSITIHNQYSRDQTLVKATRFLLNDVLYRLLEGVTVKAGTSLPATLEADKSGAGFELRLGDKLTIPGLWPGIQTQIFGIADTELRPGLATVRVITQGEVDLAEQKALDELRNEVVALKTDDPESFTFGFGGEVEIEHPELEETVQPSVRVTQSFHILKVSKQAVNEYVNSTVRGMEKDKAALLDMDRMMVEVIDLKERPARLHLTLPVGFYTPVKEEDFDVGVFRSKNEVDVRRILQEKYGIVDVAVNYSPLFFKPLLPRIGKVRLTILEP